jgi:hypothetical protein
MTEFSLHHSRLPEAHRPGHGSENPTPWDGPGSARRALKSIIGPLFRGPRPLPLSSGWAIPFPRRSRRGRVHPTRGPDKPEASRQERAGLRGRLQASSARARAMTSGVSPVLVFLGPGEDARLSGTGPVDTDGLGFPARLGGHLERARARFAGGSDGPIGRSRATPRGRSRASCRRQDAALGSSTARVPERSDACPFLCRPRRAALLSKWNAPSGMEELARVVRGHGRRSRV